MRRFLAGTALSVGLVMVVSGLWGMRGCAGEIVAAVFYMGEFLPPRWMRTDQPFLEGLFSLAWALGFWQLHKYGRNYFRRNRLVAIHALNLLRSEGWVDAQKLIFPTGCRDEIEVRLHIAELRRRGVLPAEAEPQIRRRMYQARPVMHVGEIPDESTLSPHRTRSDE